MNGIQQSTSLAPPATSLYIQSPVRNYARGRLEELAAELTRVDAGVAIAPTAKLPDLRLMPDGVTETDGYAYTYCGFSDLCRILAGGLITFLPDLAGAAGRQAFDPELSDIQTAIGIFNLVLTRRFRLLQDKQVVINKADHTIDGLVGSQHRFLDNRAILDSAEEAVQGTSHPEQFYGATLAGRRLTLFYRSASPLFTIRLDGGRQEHFWTGHYLCNGESGRMSLRGTVALFNQFGTSLGTFTGSGGTIRHVGQNCSRRATQLISRAFAMTQDSDALQAGVRQLVGTHLRLDGPESQLVQNMERLRRLFVRRKISTGIANDILDFTVWTGADAAPMEPGAIDPIDAYASAARLRTGYDLYCAMVRRSLRLDPLRREQVEQLANDLLLGSIRLYQ